MTRLEQLKYYIIDLSVTIKQIPDELLLLDDATGPVRRLLLLAAVGVAVDDG